MDRMKRLGCLAVLLCVVTALSGQGLASWGEESPKPVLTADNAASQARGDDTLTAATPAKPLIKATLATFPTTGLSLGFEVKPGYDKKVRSFFNLEAMTCLGAANSIGANAEFRRQPARGSGFYYSGFFGVELVFYDRNWLVQDSSPSIDMLPIPQAAGAVGYQWEYGDRDWFFVEAKAGVMVFVGTLRVGMIF